MIWCNDWQHNLAQHKWYPHWDYNIENNDCLNINNLWSSLWIRSFKITSKYVSVFALFLFIRLVFSLLNCSKLLIKQCFVGWIIHVYMLKPICYVFVCISFFFKYESQCQNSGSHCVCTQCLKDIGLCSNTLKFGHIIYTNIWKIVFEY